MQTHQLKRNHPNMKRMIVARGGKRGKTSGRGGKGQSARAGNKRRPEWRDIIKKLPKLRGRGVNQNKGFQEKPVVVNLSILEGVFAANELITPTILIEKGLIKTWSGNVPLVKILGDGELTKALKFSGCFVSSSAKAKIEKAGGSITPVASRILVKAPTEAQAKRAAAPKKPKAPKPAKSEKPVEAKSKKAGKPEKPANKDKEQVKA
jgi:large subunit ribosomal protein L15